MGKGGDEMADWSWITFGLAFCRLSNESLFLY